MLSVQNVNAGYGKFQALFDVSLEVNAGEAVAVIGSNGAGKSTLLKVIMGELDPLGGSAKLGANVDIAYFAQHQADELDQKLSVLETMEEVSQGKNGTGIRGILGTFLFRGDDVFKKVGVLSGGERSRVALVCLLIQPANFLILDEPTNHLDVQSQAVLQQALAEYPGAYLIVSHNRSFLDPIVTKTLEFRPGESPQIYHGNVTYYLDKKTEEKAAGKSGGVTGTPTLSSLSSSATAAAAPAVAKGPKLSRKEQRKLEAEKRQQRNKVLNPLKEEFERLEANISKLEAQKIAITTSLASAEILADPKKSKEANAAFQKVNDQLDTAISRWDTLSEEIELLEESLATTK